MKKILKNTLLKHSPSMALLLVFSLCISAFSFTGCKTSLTEPVSVTGYKLNTYVTIKAYSAGSNPPSAVTDILNEALALCDYYEQLFSRTRTDSVLYAVNHQQRTQIPAELAELIQLGIDYSSKSNGAFDLTIGSVSKLWDFTAENPSVPDSSAIADAVQHVDYRQVHLQAETTGNDTVYRIHLPENVEIDLGAIAKGYIADRIKDFLLEKGIGSAVINLGGNVLCVGSKENGSDFNIAIRKPFDSENAVLVSLKINDRSAVTSGTYERCFYENDTLYHHILNPKNGYPYQNKLVSVTIISDDSAAGDALSTTCFSLGLTDGLALIEQMPDVEALFVTDDGTLHYSSGFDAYIQH